MRIISGAFKGRILKTSSGPGFRPAMGRVREALFSMLEACGVDWRESRVLDLFAGSGSLGFEALSRGAVHACFVESAAYAAAVIAKNAELLHIDRERIAIVREETAKVLARRPAMPFSVVFIDPPYQKKILEPTLNTLMKNQWVSPGGIINAEVEARDRLDPEKTHPLLEPLADRSYGQTRVILWKTSQQQPSIPAPLIP